MCTLSDKWPLHLRALSKDGAQPSCAEMRAPARPHLHSERGAAQERQAPAEAARCREALSSKTVRQSLTHLGSASRTCVLGTWSQTVAYDWRQTGQLRLQVMLPWQLCTPSKTSDYPCMQALPGVSGRHAAFATRGQSSPHCPCHSPQTLKDGPYIPVACSLALAQVPHPRTGTQTRLFMLMRRPYTLTTPAAQRREPAARWRRTPRASRRPQTGAPPQTHAGPAPALAQRSGLAARRPA